MAKIIDYKIERDRELKNVETAVQNGIRQGWQPYGYLHTGEEQVRPSGNRLDVYIQVMVKYEDNSI